MLVECRIGQLPWRRMKDKADAGKMKQTVGINALLDELPAAFTRMRDCIVGLGYADMPDYDELDAAFTERLAADGLLRPVKWDWDQPRDAVTPGSGGLTAPAVCVGGREGAGDRA